MYEADFIDEKDIDAEEEEGLGDDWQGDLGDAGKDEEEENPVPDAKEEEV